LIAKIMTIPMIERNPAARAGVSIMSHEYRRTRDVSDLEADIPKHTGSNSALHRFPLQKYDATDHKYRDTCPKQKIRHAAERRSEENSRRAISHRRLEILKSC
jgi:hypothetical protein